MMRAVMVTQFILGFLTVLFALYQNDMMVFGFGCGIMGAVAGAWFAEAFIRHS
jgi:hypothetical protein